MVALYRGGNRYDIHFERLADAPAADAGREALMRERLCRYVARLEHYCRGAPYNWFNFYDFWK
jgi:predicted LPLAT superfamily acyltransferase